MANTFKRTMIAALACGALFGLAGCETATPYQPLNAAHADAGGYSDHQIEANRFQISFSGNSVTSRETVERYLLYRSAELTLAQGYDWFEAAGRNTDKKTQTFAEPGAFGCGYGPGWCGGLGGGSDGLGRWGRGRFCRSWLGQDCGRLGRGWRNRFGLGERRLDLRYSLGVERADGLATGHAQCR